MSKALLYMQEWVEAFTRQCVCVCTRVCMFGGGCWLGVGSHLGRSCPQAHQAMLGDVCVCHEQEVLAQSTWSSGVLISPHSARDSPPRERPGLCVGHQSRSLCSRGCKRALLPSVPTQTPAPGLRLRPWVPLPQPCPSSSRLRRKDHKQVIRLPFSLVGLGNAERTAQHRKLPGAEEQTGSASS